MTHVPECGIGVVIQQNGDGTETACAACPFSRSGLCPNGRRLPFCRTPEVVGSIDAQRNRDALGRFVNMIGQSCRGPRKP